VTVRDLARDDGLDKLTADECSALLGQHHLGRLGLTSASLPVILPTSFAMDGDAPMFWSGDGLKLHAARNGHVACLEIDGHDDLEQSGWSVLVIGRLAEIVGERQRSRYEHVPIPQWRHITDSHLIRLEPTLVSGRRLNGGVPARAEARREGW
jgi:uncharacterized protein